MSQRVETADPATDGAEILNERAGGTRRWLLIALVAGFLLQIGWRIWLSRNLITPAAHADEDGYLLSARALAGGPGGESTENDSFRRVGYPMLIAPVYWFVSDSFQVYRGVLILNAVFNALVFPLAYLFARRVFDLPRRIAVGGAFAVALLPAVVFYSEFAMTDAVLAPIAMSWLLLAHRWLTAQTARGRLIGALGSGAVAGFFYVVHVRGTMVVLAHGALVVSVVLLRRVGWRPALASVAATGVTILLDPLLKAVIGTAMHGAGNSPKSQTINAFTTVEGVVRTVGGAGGQLWYLCVATLGLGAVGLVASVRPFVRRGARAALRTEIADRVLGARRIIVSAVLATTLFIALGSSAALPPDDQRINYFAYPRYIHLFFPLWVLIGLFALREAAAARRRVLVLFAGGAAVTVVLTAVVWARVRGVENSTFLGFDAPEVSFIGWRWRHIGVGRPTAVALAAFAAITAAVVLRARAGLAAALAGFAVVQVVTMPFVVDRVTLPMEDQQYTPASPRLVQQGYLHEGDVVAWARRQNEYYSQYNMAREVNWTTLLIFDQDKHQPVPPTANVVIGPYEPTKPKLVGWDGTQYGFHLVVVDPVAHWALWRR